MKYAKYMKKLEKKFGHVISEYDIENIMIMGKKRGIRSLQGDSLNNRLEASLKASWFDIPIDFVLYDEVLKYARETSRYNYKIYAADELFSFEAADSLQELNLVFKYYETDEYTMSREKSILIKKPPSTEK